MFRRHCRLPPGLQRQLLPPVNVYFMSPEMMLRRVEPCQEWLFLLVFILVFFFLYLQQLKEGSAVAVARESSRNCCVAWWWVCKFTTAWEQCVNHVSEAPCIPALHISSKSNCTSWWWPVRGLQMVLCVPQVASIWGLTCKDFRDFSSLIPQVGSNLSPGILLCPVRQTHSILCLQQPHGPWVHRQAAKPRISEAYFVNNSL